MIIQRGTNASGRLFWRAVLLGGKIMSALSQNADGPSEDWTGERAILLLEQALRIIDHWGGSPAIGARLQHVIDELREATAS